jgi:hypothetical protein
VLLVLGALVLAACSSKAAVEHHKKGNEHVKQKKWAEAIREYDLSLRPTRHRRTSGA